MPECQRTAAAAAAALQLEMHGISMSKNSVATVFMYRKLAKYINFIRVYA